MIILKNDIEKNTYLLAQRIRKFAQEHLEKGDKILVAVSGGPDSVALLHLLLEVQQEYQLSLVLAHVEHGIRSEESHEQAGFVQNLGEKLGLECFIHHVDVPGISKIKKMSLEEAAREARYSFLEETAQRVGAAEIALGHTANDQAETLLMRLLRGAGLEGLAAMRSRREGKVPLVRPLLNIFRWEVMDFLNERKISFCLDSTNCEVDYLRNKIRLQLLPLLSREYNPRILATLHRTATLLGEERVWLSSQVKVTLQQCLRQSEGEGMAINLDLFLVLPLVLQREVLREAVQQVGSGPYKIGFSQVSTALRWLREGRPGGTLHLADNLCLKKQVGSLLIAKREPKAAARPGGFCYRINIPGETFVPELNLRILARILRLDPDERIKPRLFEAKKAYLDFDALPNPLFIRKRQTGDSFQPLGMSGHKKLKKFFIDEKIPEPVREKTPLLASGHEIVWVFERRIAEPFKVTEKTKSILLIEKIDPHLPRVREN